MYFFTGDITRSSLWRVAEQKEKRGRSVRCRSGRYGRGMFPLDEDGGIGPRVAANSSLLGLAARLDQLRLRRRERTGRAEGTAAQAGHAACAGAARALDHALSTHDSITFENGEKHWAEQ